MRKSYADYGLTEKRVKELFKDCRMGKHAALVRKAAYQVDPLTAEHIILSIMQNKAYDLLEFHTKFGRVPCGRTNFYGIRRQTIALLNDMLTGKQT